MKKKQGIIVQPLHLMSMSLLLAGLLTTGNALAERQPAMKIALNKLYQAETALVQAKRDKGGHRVEALGLVRKAIAAVKKGIRFDNRH